MASTAYDSWMDPTAPWQAKLQRAGQHLRSLTEQVGAFRESDPYSVTPESTDKPGRLAHRLRYLKEVPVEISTTIGDVLHNQRSALENLAFELAKRSHGGVLTPAQEGASTFPIRESPEKFAAFFADRNRASLYDEKAKSALRAAQPFIHLESAISYGIQTSREYPEEFRWSSLHRLDRLWNVDKHRRLALMAWWPDIFWWGSDGESKRTAFRGDGTLADGSILLYTEGTDEGQDDRLNYEFNLTLTDDPAFSRDGTGATGDVVKLLQSFQETISWSVFNPTFSIMTTQS